MALNIFVIKNAWIAILLLIILMEIISLITTYCYCLKHNLADGMLLGAACCFDCGCIYCVVMCGKFYIYFMRVCYDFDISTNMPLLTY